MVVIHSRDIATEKYAGMASLDFGCGVSESHPCMAKMTATLEVSVRNVTTKLPLVLSTYHPINLYGSVYISIIEE